MSGLVPIVADPWIGRRIGGAFIVRARVATTSIGAFYRVDQDILARSLTLLLIDEALSRDAAFRRRLHERASIRSKLTHPAIVSLIDAGETEEGVLYHVLEYVPGCTLGELIDVEGPLPTRRSVGMFRLLLDGLNAVHEAGIAHGALGRDTVLIEQPRGHGDWVKIAGLSTPPEHGGVASQVADLHAAASLFYEMLTKARPDAAWLAPPSRARRSPTTSVALDAVVLRALSSRPADRYPDARTLRDAIDLAVNAAPPAPAHARRRGGIDPDDARVTLRRHVPPSIEERSRCELGRAALKAGRPGGAVTHFRAALARAIHRGDADRMVELYLDIARALVAAGDLPGAASELREGIDLVTAGEGLTTDAPPHGFWRLALLLADLDRSAHRRNARPLAIAAARHAKREGTTSGVSRALALAASIDRERGKDRQPGDRLPPSNELKSLGH